MPDPYAPAGPVRARAAGEVRSPLQQFLQRLADLGATVEEQQGVEDYWDDLDPDGSTDPDAYTAADRAKLMESDDDALRAIIRAGRDEYNVGTTTEVDAAGRERDHRHNMALAEALGRLGGNVDGVLAWVGDDLVRAQVTYELEAAEDGARRKTLLGPLAALIEKHQG